MRSAASKSVGPDGTEIIGRDGPALAVRGAATVLAAAAPTGLPEDFSVEAMFIDVDGVGIGAEACAEEADDSVRVKK
jgi:hypothetical protein